MGASSIKLRTPALAVRVSAWIAAHSHPPAFLEGSNDDERVSRRLQCTVTGDREEQSPFIRLLLAALEVRQLSRGRCDMRFANARCMHVVASFRSSGERRSWSRQAAGCVAFPCQLVTLCFAMRLKCAENYNDSTSVRRGVREEQNGRAPAAARPRSLSGHPCMLHASLSLSPIPTFP